MALGSEAFITFAAFVLLTNQTAELRHDHVWKSGSGTLQVTPAGISWSEPQAPKHNRTWRWEDIQQLELTAGAIRILTYEDARWRAYRDREYLLQGLPEGLATELADSLREHLREKFVSAIARNTGDAAWSIPVKLRQGLGGSEGELIFAPGVLVYRSPERDQSRTWPIGQIEMISSSGPYELTVLPHEQNGWTRGRREFRFQLKRPIGDREYQHLWMSVQKTNGLVINVTGLQHQSSEKEDQ